MEKGLRIAKGGKLINHFHKYDETLPKKERHQYLEEDVTHLFVSRLFNRCYLDDDVTLKDIFLLLNTELKIMDMIISNWCEEIVTEGLNSEGKIHCEYNPNEIEYLELYWIFEKNSKWDEKRKAFNPEDTQLTGHTQVDFHGVGYELKENKLYNWIDKETGELAIEYAKGTRINWSLSFLSPGELINLPVKLRKNIVIYDATQRMTKGEQIIAEFMDCEYTLGQILYGIIWELSFHGPQESRDKKKNEVENARDEAMSGKGKFRSLEEVFKELDEED